MAPTGASCRNCRVAQMVGSALTYTACDEYTPAGVSYYRIKQTDAPGKSACTDIKEIDFARDFSHINVFPNPARDFFIVRGNSLQNVQPRLYNRVGELIALPYRVENKSITFHTTGLTRGIYFLRLPDIRGNELAKIIIQ
jgi:hypothetical protein